MKMANGQVMINECPSKSRLFKFCEKKIDQWLSSHVTSTEEPAEFRVSFTSGDDETNQFSCVTEIQLGSQVLRGADVDGDQQAAFLHSLKRLHAALQPQVEASL